MKRGLRSVRMLKSHISTRGHMHKLLLSFSVAILIVTGCSHANAQQKVTPEKEALIKELLAVTGATKSVRDVAEAMMKYQQSESEEMISSMVDGDKSLTAAEKAELKKTITETVANLTRRIADFYAKDINLEQIIEEVTIPMYDRNFTASELREFVAFYRSPTGQKVITLMPAMMMESMKGFSEKLAPKLSAFMKKATDEEFAVMKQKIEASQKPKSKL